MPEQLTTPTPSKASSAPNQARIRKAVALHQAQRFADAARLYEEVLQTEPDNFDALHLLGVILVQNGRAQHGMELIKKALQRNPASGAAYGNLGFALSALGRDEEALAAYDRAIALRPGDALAYLNRGTSLKKLGRSEDALASFDAAIALKPDYAEAHSNRAVALNALGRAEDALASADKAIALKPSYAGSHNNRGIALFNLKRYEEALVSYDRAITLTPDDAELFNNRGNALNGLDRYEEALASFATALALRPDYAEAYSNRANSLNALRRSEEALASCDRALALIPDFANAYIGRGTILKSLDRQAEALASLDRAIALKPESSEAYLNRGNILFDLERPDEAFASFEKALELKPDIRFLSGNMISLKLQIGDWKDVPARIEDLVHRIEREEEVSIPFAVLGVTSSSKIQRQAAEIYTSAKYPRSDDLPRLDKRPRRDRVRLGYFSADFHDHATARLMAELFERHDKARFETIAFSFGPDTNDAMRQRVRSAFDRFIDVRYRADKEIAMLARELGVDIAVDLKGVTGSHRQQVFAYGAAPIQVSYLGFPGTMGADYIDYLIADPVLIPETSQKHYTEKIVYLPDTYQPNDTKRVIAAHATDRAEAGLPDGAFVYCCFNNNFKVNPDTFDIWMRILRRVERSVLWLLEDNKSVAANLRKEAVTRGIDEDRLVFAKRLPLPDHLARHRLADLFLDTLPYNAHTTTSDALWAGLPVLTLAGETFAGRVSASLLNAIGLAELITTTPGAYEALAVELAIDRKRLAAIKNTLAQNRLTAPLFDAARFTKHIEAAFLAIYERYQADLPPDHIWIRAQA